MASVLGVIIPEEAPGNMGPLTANRPKALLPVAGRPLLAHQLEALAGAGAGQAIVVCCGPAQDSLGKLFMNYKTPGLETSFCDAPTLGQALRFATRGRRQSSPVVALRGDFLASANGLRGLLAQTGPARGVVGTGAAKASAAMLAPPELLPQLERLPWKEMEIAFRQLALDGKQIAELDLPPPWMRLAYPWDLLAAAEALLADLRPFIGEHSTIESGVNFVGNVEVGPRSVIRSGVYIEGPARIGAECIVGPNCYIRPSTVIGDRCHIGAGVEIKNSLIFSGTAVPHLSYVGDSIIAEDSNLGAGTVIANLRHDERPVRMLGMNTGRRKLGAVIGARVKTGINVSIGRPGTVIGNDCRIAPGAVVLRDWPDGAVVYAGANYSKGRRHGHYEN